MRGFSRRRFARLKQRAGSGLPLTLRFYVSHPPRPDHLRSALPEMDPDGDRRTNIIASIASIGTVTRTTHGSFDEQLKTLSIQAMNKIVANLRKANSVQPDYRLIAGNVEIGAGRSRHSDISGRDYV